MRFTDTENYWRVTFGDSSKFSDFKTVRFADGLMIIGRFSDGGIKVHSLLFPKESYSSTKAKILSYYYEGVFK